MNIAILILAILFIVFLFLFKGEMHTVISKKMQEQAGDQVQSEVMEYLDSAFNYTRNNEPFTCTFLEFGAIGCVACKRMEKVMREVREHFPKRVQVRFVNVLLPENQDLMKVFGISAIPTQVLLDSTGREYFRHTGFYSFNELKTKLLN